MSKIGLVDRRIFSGDLPFEEKDATYEWFEKRISTFLRRSLKHDEDRCFVPQVETMVAMLWRLSSYFDNTATARDSGTLGSPHSPVI
jgi:hypothetical protein